MKVSIFPRVRLISISSLLFISFVSQAFSTDPSIYFPNVAQGHSQSPNRCPDEQLNINGSAKINGTQGKKLNFCTSNKGAGLPNDSCDDGAGGYQLCEITYHNTPALILPPFKSRDSSNEEECDSGKQNYTKKKYDEIKVSASCEVNLYHSDNVQFINELTIKDGTVILSTGDYWVEELKMNSSAHIKVAGNARLFLKENVEFNSTSKITIDNGGSFSLIAYDTITLNSDSYIEGDVYSNKELTLNSKAYIAGRVSSETLVMNTNSRINGSIIPPTPLPPATLTLRLDEDSWNGTMGEVKDSSGNSLNGTAINKASPQKNNPAWPTNDNLMGTCGYAQFNQSQNQYIEVPNNDKLSDEETITVSAWINPISYPDKDLSTIVSKNGNYEFHLNSKGQVFWYWELKGNHYPVTLTTTQSVPLDEWSHIAIRYDARNTKKATIFIDGVEVRSYIDSNSSVKKLSVNNDPLQIGNDYNLSRTFDGLIDEVNVFTEALTDTQINQLYQQRHPCPDVVLPTCYEDDFNNGSLSSHWITSKSSGYFTPSIVSGRLKLTENSPGQSTASSFQYLYPALGNKIEIEFDYMAYGSGTGADGLAVVFSDAEVTPQAGAFGGPLGYGFKKAESAPGFAGGWVGIGLDEYGNYSKEGGTKNKNSGGTTAQSVVLRGSGQQYTGYNYIDGETVSPRIDGNDGKNETHRYRITIDSRSNNTANVTVERSVIAVGRTPNFKSLIGPINVLNNQYNQDEIPENFIMSLTGSTGMLDNTHEIDNFKMCALYSKPIGEQIDHFEFTHSGQGSTCDVSNVTLRACADASCSSLFTDEIDVTLNTSNLGADGYWLNGNNVTMTNGIAKLSIGKPTQGDVTLGVYSSSPSTKPFSNTLCRINGGSSSSQNCTLNFKSEGLTVTVPDKLANKLVTATIKGCGSTFTGTKQIQLWSDYISPNQDNIIGSPSISVNNNSNWNNIGKTESQATTLTLNFANNEAKVDLNYADAGQLQLNAKYTKSYNQDIEGSDQFVSFPIGLSVSVTDKNNSNLNGLCESEDTSCPVFARAGETFNLNIKAHAWMGDNDSKLADNPVTPNYAQDNLILDHILVAPSQKIGGNTGNLLINTYNHAAKQGSTNTFKQSISEVGVFDISVTPPTGYLGSNAFQIKAANTGSIGRFIPAYFDLSAEQPTITNACRTYTYMGQTFVFDTLPTLEITPLSYTGGRLQNYSIGQWWRYNNAWNLRTYSASPSDIAVIDSDSLSILGRRDGFATSGNVDKLPLQNKVQLQNAKLRYNKPFDPISPTNDTITLTLSAEDTEDLDEVCYKTNATGNCLEYNFPATPEHQQEWGRITMEDAYGSELNDLQSRIETESYVGGRFIRNSDSCTIFSLSDFRFNVGTDPNALPVGKGTTKASFDNAQNTQVKDGVTSMDFTAPGNGNQGQVIPTLSLVKLPWLQQDQDNNDSFEDFIKATIHFGIYRGSDRIIWSHEQTD